MLKLGGRKRCALKHITYQEESVTLMVVAHGPEGTGQEADQPIRRTLPWSRQETGERGGCGGSEKGADSEEALEVTRQPWVLLGCSGLEVHCPGGVTEKAEGSGGETSGQPRGTQHRPCQHHCLANEVRHRHLPRPKMGRHCRIS